MPRVVLAAPLAGLLVWGGLEQAAAVRTHRVLFIGNSLTSFNDLPGTFAELVRLGGDSVVVESVALPNLALIDHALGQSPARAAILRGGWTTVVLQQGPTRLGICRDTLVRGVRLLNESITAVGARAALLMTWPAARDSGNGGFDAVRESYQLGAQEVQGLFLPAGEAWRSAWRRDSAIALYGPDGYHPAPLGTYLAALVTYERLTGRDPRTLPGATSASRRVLHEAAHEANERFAALPRGIPYSPAPVPPRPIGC